MLVLGFDIGPFWWYCSHFFTSFCYVLCCRPVPHPAPHPARHQPHKIPRSPIFQVIAVVKPHVPKSMPVEYLPWVDVAISYAVKLVAITFAWSVQKFMSAIQVRGSDAGNRSHQTVARCHFSSSIFRRKERNKTFLSSVREIVAKFQGNMYM